MSPTAPQMLKTSRRSLNEQKLSNVRNTSGSFHQWLQIWLRLEMSFAARTWDWRSYLSACIRCKWYSPVNSLVNDFFWGGTLCCNGAVNAVSATYHLSLSSDENIQGELARSRHCKNVSSGMDHRKNDQNVEENGTMQKSIWKKPCICIVQWWMNSW